MTTETSAAKARLLEALRASEQRLIDRLSGLPPEHFEQGAYESGWNRRQILAHVASIEWTYPRLLDVAKEGTPLAPGQRPPEVRQTEPQEGLRRQLIGQPRQSRR